MSKISQRARYRLGLIRWITASTMVHKVVAGEVADVLKTGFW